MGEPERGFDPDRDNAIGGALLNTEHIGGFARRAPYFVRDLEAAGWTVVPAADRAVEPVGLAPGVAVKIDDGRRPLHDGGPLRSLDDVDVEAGSYIEDDPAAWAALLMGIRRYAGDLPALVEQFGDGGYEIGAGALLGYLADQHKVFIRSDAARLPPAEGTPVG